MKHPITTLLKYCTGNDWAMREHTLRQMSGVIERHVNGVKLGDDEILAITTERDERVTERKFEIVGAAAIIPVTGVIAKHSSMVNGCSQPEGTSVETMRGQLFDALEDPRVESIFLMIDSPGGSIDGLADFADEVFAASFQKPVVAFADDLCASAAYWIASQAGAIYANQTADIGSIGVYAIAVDSSERAKQEGLKFHIFRSGDNKGVGAPGIEITEDQRAVIQERIDAKFEIFLDAIMQGRGSAGLDKDDLRALADGRCFVGAAALGHNLIDGIMTMGQAMSRTLPAVRENRSDVADASAKKSKVDSIGDNIMAKEPEKVDASIAAKQATDAVTKDRERVAGINEALAGAEFGELRAKAIETGMTVDAAKAAAFEIRQKASTEKIAGLNEQVADGQKRLDAISSAGSDYLAAETTDEETTTTAKATGDSDDASVYEKYREQLMGNGATEAQAIKKASVKYPKSHEAAVKEMPVSTAK